MNTVAKLIRRETGLPIKEFCEKELQTEYKGFLARLNKNRLYPAEIFYICWRTRKRIVDLFGSKWHDVLIISQGGSIAERVRDIIEKMSDAEKIEIMHLLGFTDEVIQKSLPPPSPDPKPLPEPKPEIPEPQAPETTKEDTMEALKSLFIKTY